MEREQFAQEKISEHTREKIFKMAEELEGTLDHFVGLEETPDEFLIKFSKTERENDKNDKKEGSVNKKERILHIMKKDPIPVKYKKIEELGNTPHETEEIKYIPLEDFVKAHIMFPGENGIEEKLTLLSELKQQKEKS